MKSPIFAHGSLAGVQRLVDEGTIKYPAYCWVTDTNQYYFLNENNEFECIGLPEVKGTLGHDIIVASLDDGIYKITGNYKITENDTTTFSTSSFIFGIVSSEELYKKIKIISAGDIYDYIVTDGGVNRRTHYVTDQFLEDNGYVTEEIVDAKLLAMETILEDELKSYVEMELLDTVPEIIDRTIQRCGEEAIRDLFN